MADANVPWVAIGFAVPLLLVLGRPVLAAVSERFGVVWAWWIAALAAVILGEGTGLLEGLGIDPQAAKRLVLCLGLLLVLLTDFWNRISRPRLRLTGVKVRNHP